MELRANMEASIDKHIEGQRTDGQFKGIRALQQRKFILDAQSNLRKTRSTVKHLLSSNIMNAEGYQAQLQYYQNLQQKQMVNAAGEQSQQPTRRLGHFNFSFAGLPQDGRSS